MSDEKKTPVPPRIVEATLTRGAVSLGHVDIIGSTKMGSTALLAFETDEVVEDGDRLKTKVYILNSREFEIVKAHAKPMKIPGVWYEVRTIAAAAAKPKGRKS
jgi:hypothetical protein